MAKKSKYVFSFGDRKAEGKEDQRALLGGKGANLHGMTKLGLPVPAGFTISTEVCTYYYGHKQSYPKSLTAEVKAAMVKLEKTMGRKFGSPTQPLLVSVRSGARASMPGMMDTILNLGLNDQTVEALAKESNDARFSYDSYRRFITMYSDVVLNIHANHFEAALEDAKHAKGVELDTELSADDLKKLVHTFKQIIKTKGAIFPEDPWEQLWGAVGAVFGSWMSPRAITYRKLNEIPESWGTAVNVQSMVFGNMGDDCATGVAFTRDPSTGEKKFFGEFLVNAQGEDVVAGIRNPQPINESSRIPGGDNQLPTLEFLMPKAYGDLVKVYQKLEKHYRDMQDIEFTIERGKLYMLQTRSGKRTAAAALRIAVDMVKEKLITKTESISRVKPEQLDQLLHPGLDPKAKKTVLCKGLPASPGAATGQIVFDPETAEKWVKDGKKVILVRLETSPEDIHGMSVSQGILTARGGMTCVAPETRILTDRGYFSAEKAFETLEKGENLRILSFDSSAMKPVWRNIIAAGKKPSQVLTAAISQTGRAEENTLRLTEDHKMYTIAQRRLVKKPIKDVLKDGDFLTVLTNLPGLGEAPASPSLAYAAGALLSDGCIRLWDTKDSVTFIQKPTPEKADFIAAVERCFEDAFGVPFSYIRERTTVGEIKGRKIQGSVEDRICFRREPAERLAEIKDNLTAWVLQQDEVALRHFLAGYVDGDGTYAEESSAVRIQISISGQRQGMIEGLATACLRLGIVPQITPNRENFTIQIAEKVESILAYTQRVHAEIPPRTYESRCLTVKGLFSDIVDSVNFMGRVREGIKRELMFGAEKIRRDILPLCTGESRGELERILDSSLRSFRVSQVKDLEPAMVYNFEVDATSEIDKNYIAFTSRMTPVLISNSHAAVVARGMGKCCVSGCAAIKISYDRKEFSVGSTVLREGDALTLDGSSGEVILGTVPTVAAQLNDQFREFMSWVDEYRLLKVRTNADTPHDSKVARGFGAEGIGLCRTEHMFFDADRIDSVREMILADTPEGRQKALDKILPMQRTDFVGIFTEMMGLPVTIRLLDPPLHEFIPHTDEELRALSAKIQVPFERLKRKAETLHEFNPMLGHRGCRLGVSFPEIYRTQVRAIMEAACEVVLKNGEQIVPEIMIPLVGDYRELRYVRQYCVDEVEGVIRKQAESFRAQGLKPIKYLIGTMIELPRAALTAAEIAQDAEFFSFGTNDLTQTTYGLSRDDSGLFLKDYLDAKIYEKDPFQTLDPHGVGRLMKFAQEEGSQVRPDLKVGICGEHGGDPSSIHFCHSIGLDYVSCSPYRVPIARLAAAQAAIEMPRKPAKKTAKKVAKAKSKTKKQR